jgi:hypothetical protein
MKVNIKKYDVTWNSVERTIKLMKLGIDAAMESGSYEALF